MAAFGVAFAIGLSKIMLIKNGGPEVGLNRRRETETSLSMATLASHVLSVVADRDIAGQIVHQ